MATVQINESIWGNLLNAAKSGVVGNLTTFLQNMTSDAVGLVDQEATDFDTAITLYSEDIQAGMTPQAAWTKEFAPFAAQAKSDAWNAAMKALTDGLSFLDGIVKTIEAAI
jgi:hypothetical protein